MLSYVLLTSIVTAILFWRKFAENSKVNAISFIALYGFMTGFFYKKLLLVDALHCFFMAQVCIILAVLFWGTKLGNDYPNYSGTKLAIIFMMVAFIAVFVPIAFAPVLC